MIASLPRGPARRLPWCAFAASPDLPTADAVPQLNVVDGLVSVGHQPWMTCPGSPVLQ